MPRRGRELVPRPNKPIWLAFLLEQRFQLPDPGSFQVGSSVWAMLHLRTLIGCPPRVIGWNAMSPRLADRALSFEPALEVLTRSVGSPPTPHALSGSSTAARTGRNIVDPVVQNRFRAREVEDDSNSLTLPDQRLAELEIRPLLGETDEPDRKQPTRGRAWRGIDIDRRAPAPYPIVDWGKARASDRQHRPANRLGGRVDPACCREQCEQQSRSNSSWHIVPPEREPRSIERAMLPAHS